MIDRTRLAVVLPVDTGALALVCGQRVIHGGHGFCQLWPAQAVGEVLRQTPHLQAFRRGRCESQPFGVGDVLLDPEHRLGQGSNDRSNRESKLLCKLVRPTADRGGPLPL